MNAYLFTASVIRSQAQTGRVWDQWSSLIICADSPEEAQKRFEDWLHHSPEGQAPIETQIKRIVATQFIEELLTESGREPIDWTQLNGRLEATVPTAEGDDFSQGYWADANQLVRPDSISADLDSLQRELPEDVASGLNWADQQYFFIVTVLTPLPSPTEWLDNLKSATANAEGVLDESAENESAPIDPVEAALPEMRDKEVAALVQARNAVVAAWLWRKFAAETPYAAHEIDIDPWCWVALPEPQEKPSPT